MLACSWLPPVLARYRSLYPQIAVTVTDTTADRVVETVRQGEAEIGIGPERPAPDTVQSDLPWQERMQCVCPASSPLAQRAQIAWADRKSVVEGKGVSVRVEFGGRRIIKKKIKK